MMILAYRFAESKRHLDDKQVRGPGEHTLRNGPRHHPKVNNTNHIRIGRFPSKTSKYLSLRMHSHCFSIYRISLIRAKARVQSVPEANIISLYLINIFWIFKRIDSIGYY